MKKLLFALALVGFTTAAQAQNEAEYPVLKHKVVTNSFWSNWFVGAGFDVEIANCDQEKAIHWFPNQFSKDRLGLGGEIYIGKWFAPSVGVRLRGHLGSSRRVGLLYNLANPKQSESYMAFNVQMQTMFNLNNIIAGYNPNRVWSISPYFGLGFAHHMAYSGGNTVYVENGVGGSKGDWSPIASLGLFNQFNVSKRCFIALDIYIQSASGKHDGEWMDGFDTGILHSRDFSYGASLGLGFNIGKTGWQNTPDVAGIMAAHQSALDALNKSISDQEAENKLLRDKLANRKPEIREKVVTEVVTGSTPASVFFDINSSKIKSKKELLNVEQVAEVAKQQGKKIVVTGYADSCTGSPSRNQTLSEQRANAVADALVRMGVDRSNIITEAKGGVNELDPCSYNRRAVVTIQ